MPAREIAFSFAPTEAHEAPGVTINRAIGGDRMALLDPFLLLDHVTLDPSANTDVIGFPRHPHRGIETLSYVIDGEVTHKDSLGNEGKVGAGGSQWMTAGNGIWHEEMLGSVDGRGEFLQLWFSLPMARKRIPAAYMGAESVPSVSVGEGATVGVAAGSFQGTAGAFQGIAVKPVVFDLLLPASSSVAVPTESGANAFAYVVRGEVSVAGKPLSAPILGILTDGDQVTITAGAEGARVFFCAAKPLNEPVLQYRSFVMNTVADIAETVGLIESGTFAK